MTDSITLTVPAEHADAFRPQAAETVEFRLSNVAQSVRWQARGVRHRADVDYELDRLAEALNLNAIVEAGDLRVVVNEQLRDTIVGCLLNAEQALGDQLEAADTDCAVAWRALAETAVWLGLLEKVEEENRAT